MVNKVLTAKQAKKLDSLAKEKFSIPTLLLMENAGRAVSDEALKALSGRKEKVALFCGRGSNGGDGFCAARHLLAKCINPDIYLCGKAAEVEGEAKINLDILFKLKKSVFEINLDNLAEVKRKVTRYALIIDALLGVGLKGEVRGAAADLINIINKSKSRVISVDIPSGLDATTGKALGACIKADKTITFVAKKKGMLTPFGRSCCGKIIVAQIGLPFKR